MRMQTKMKLAHAVSIFALVWATEPLDTVHTGVVILAMLAATYTFSVM